MTFNSSHWKDGEGFNSMLIPKLGIYLCCVAFVTFLCRYLRQLRTSQMAIGVILAIEFANLIARILNEA